MVIDCSILGNSTKEVYRLVQSLADVQTQIKEAYTAMGVGQLLRELPLEN